MYNNKKPHRTMLILLFGIPLLLLGLATTPGLAAQGPEIGPVDPFLKRAPGEQFLSVSVQPSYTRSQQGDVLNRSNYRVFRTTPSDTTRDRFLGIDRVTIDPDEDFTGLDTPDPRRSIVRIYLTDPIDVRPGDKLVVTYVGKTLAGADVDGILTASVDNPLSDPPPMEPEPTPAQPQKFTLKGAKGRDDANLYFQGEIHSASGKDLSGSVDLYFGLPFYKGASHRISPFIDLKASSSTDADPDTVKLGLEFRSTLAQSGVELSADSPVAGIRWYNDLILEGDRDYDNMNVLYLSEVRFVLKPLWLSNTHADRAFVNFTPFVGGEFGKNLKSPVAEAEDRGIVRLFLGTHMFARIYQGKETFARVTMDGLYQRRWARKDEVYFDDIDALDAQGKPIKVTVPVFFGKKSTQWAELNLNINLSEAFGFFAGYEYGELPPDYKLVDHKAKFGIVLKAKLK